MAYYLLTEYKLLEQTCGCQWGGWMGEGVDANYNIIYRMDTQQGPIILHRKLYLIYCDKL